MSTLGLIVLGLPAQSPPHCCWAHEGWHGAPGLDHEAAPRLSYSLQQEWPAESNEGAMDAIGNGLKGGTVPLGRTRQGPHNLSLRAASNEVPAAS